MLRSSIKLISIGNRTIRIVKRLNHVKTATDNGVKSEISMKYDLREKLMKVSNTALSRYNEIIGFDEIDKEYKRINQLQEDLAKCQIERTNLQLDINVIQSEISRISTELQDHQRGEAKYIELMKKEFETIQERNRLEEKFDILDQREREMFAHLQAKINILHEKSRTHTRQWGIISTIIGALLGVIGTSLSSYYRNNEIRKVQNNFQAQFQEKIDVITKDTQQMLTGYNKMIEFLNNFEHVPKEQLKETKELRNQESWGGYLKRKTWAVIKWCTFQK